MKKNIEIINVDSSLLSYLDTKLKEAKKDITNVDDFRQALSNLRDGLSSSLMIELDEDGNNNISSNEIRSGDLVIKVNSRKVIRDGKEIVLTPKEFDILYFLAKNRGDVFTKEQIYQAVWENDYLLDDSNIMAFIRKLRKKIEPNPDSPIYIITIWGIGYKFNDEI